jgi:hypothetical protein
MQNIEKQYELYEELHRSKRTKAAVLISQLIRKMQRQITEFKVSLRQSKFRSKHGGNGNFRTGSHPASLLSVLTKADSSLNSSAMFKKNVLAVSKNQWTKVIRCQFVG